MLPEGWAALHMIVPMPPSKRFNRFNKQKIIKILSSGACDFSLAHTFCMSFKLALCLSKDF
jgi:hypothetical protein